jgi:hypothetical protein
MYDKSIRPTGNERTVMVDADTQMKGKREVTEAY